MWEFVDFIIHNFLRMCVLQPCIDFLYHQVFKGMVVVSTTPHQLFAVQQVVGYTDIEIVELWRLHQSPISLDRLRIRGNMMAMLLCKFHLKYCFLNSIFNQNRVHKYE